MPVLNSAWEEINSPHIDIHGMNVVRLLLPEHHTPLVSCRARTCAYSYRTGRCFIHYCYVLYWARYSVLGKMLFTAPGRNSIERFLSSFFSANSAFTSLGLGLTWFRTWTQGREGGEVLAVASIAVVMSVQRTGKRIRHLQSSLSCSAGCWH